MIGGKYYVRSKGAIIANCVIAILLAISSFVCSKMYLFAAYELHFEFNTFGFVMMMILAISAILLIVSLSRFKSQKASSILATVSFVFIAAYHAAIAIRLLADEYTEINYYLIAFIVCLLLAFLYGLAIISALTGFRMRVFGIIAGSASFAVSFIMPVYYTFESNFFGMGKGYMIDMAFIFASEILMYFSWLFFGCAVLVHSIKNRVPAAVGKDAYASAPAYTGYQTYPPYQGGYQNDQGYQGYQNQGYQGYPAYPPYQAPAVPTPPPAPAVPAAPAAPAVPEVPAGPAAQADAAEVTEDPNSPEFKLRVLKAKLEYGIITREEYDRQRTEIINNI